MDNPVITHDFVRSLSKKIRATFGKEVPHTKVLDLIADSLNWRTDALMHKLKGTARAGSGREAPDSVSDETLRQWVVLRSWRRAEQACAGRLETTLKGHGAERAMAAACLAVCRIALGDVQGAYDAMSDVTSPDPLISLAKILVLFKRFGEAASIREEIARIATAEPEVWELTKYPRDTDVGDFAGTIASTATADPDDWNLNLQIAFNHLHEPAFLGLVYRTWAEVHEIPEKVSVEQSVGPDAVACLFDGERRKRLKTYLETKYGMTPDDYRAYWALPEDYPMVASSYAAEKRAFASGESIGPKVGH